MTAARQPEFERRLMLGERIIFAVIAEQAAAHFWAQPDWSDYSKTFAGGLEFHQKPQAGQEPSYEDCFLLNGPCCHDGSASAADALVPIFFKCCKTGDYEPIWRRVESALRWLIAEREADTGGD